MQKEAMSEEITEMQESFAKLINSKVTKKVKTDMRDKLARTLIAQNMHLNSKRQNILERERQYTCMTAIEQDTYIAGIQQGQSYLKTQCDTFLKTLQKNDMLEKKESMRDSDLKTLKKETMLETFAKTKEFIEISTIINFRSDFGEVAESSENIKDLRDVADRSISNTAACSSTSSSSTSSSSTSSEENNFNKTLHHLEQEGLAPETEREKRMVYATMKVKLNSSESEDAKKKWHEESFIEELFDFKSILNTKFFDGMKLRDFKSIKKEIKENAGFSDYLKVFPNLIYNLISCGGLLLRFLLRVIPFLIRHPTCIWNWSLFTEEKLPLNKLQFLFREVCLGIERFIILPLDLCKSIIDTTSEKNLIYLLLKLVALPFKLLRLGFKYLFGGKSARDKIPKDCEEYYEEVCKKFKELGEKFCDRPIPICVEIALGIVLTAVIPVVLPAHAAAVASVASSTLNNVRPLFTMPVALAAHFSQASSQIGSAAAMTAMISQVGNSFASTMDLSRNEKREQDRLLEENREAFDLCKKILSFYSSKEEQGQRKTIVYEIVELEQNLIKSKVDFMRFNDEVKQSIATLKDCKSMYSVEEDQSQIATINNEIDLLTVDIINYDNYVVEKRLLQSTEKHGENHYQQKIVDNGFVSIGNNKSNFWSSPDERFKLNRVYIPEQQQVEDSFQCC